MENRFIVPQFIDNEDKIWGPITVRQFVIVIVGALFGFVAYKLSDFALFIFWAVIIGLLVILVAFYRINGAPFHTFAINVIQTLKKSKIRIWHKEYIKTEEFKNKDEDKIPEYIPKKSFLPSKKLSQLSLIIDTGGIYQGEAEANANHNLNYNIKK